MPAGDEMRASDADRSAVGDRLKAALDEGRLNFHEYDTRLRDAYAAKTYGDLWKLVKDLPGPVPGVAPPAAARDSQLAPYPGASVEAQPAAPVEGGRRGAGWRGYLITVGICMAIWILVGYASGEVWYPWWMWIALPWGFFLLMRSLGVPLGEAPRWEAERARRRTERMERRARRRTGWSSS